MEVKHFRRSHVPLCMVGALSAMMMCIGGVDEALFRKILISPAGIPIIWMLGPPGMIF